MLVLNIFQGYLSFNCSEYYISNGQKRKARKSGEMFLVEYKNMFNNCSYRYSSFSEDVNYFYDALRKEGVNSEKLFDEYLEKILDKVSMSESAKQKAINNLGILFNNPFIVPMVDELIKIFSHYNLNVKSVFDLRDKWSKLGQSIENIIESKRDYSNIVEMNNAKSALMNYSFYRGLRGNENEINHFNNSYNGNLSLELVDQKLAELEPKVPYYRELLSNYEAHLNQIELEHILPPFNHSISEIKDVANKCFLIIQTIGTKLDRSIDVDNWLKYITSTFKYLKPLFQKVIIEDQEENLDEEPIFEDPSLNQNIIDILKLDKNEFIVEYLKLSNLENLTENYEFIKKLEKLWKYSQKDLQFINKLNEYENLTLNGERVDFIEIRKYLSTYKPFSLRNGPGDRSVYWYYENIDKIQNDSVEETAYQEAIKYLFNIRAGIIPMDDRYDLMVETYKSFRSLVRKLVNFDKWWDKRGENPTEYGVSIRELCEIYFKLKKDFDYVNVGEISDLLGYFDDTKFKKIFDANCKYNDGEKFELLLENFIAGNVNTRAKILSNIIPENFMKLVKSKYPDLFSILQDNNYTLPDLEHFDFSGIIQRIITSLDISMRDLKKVASKHFSEFNLNNSSIKERELFDVFEKLDLYPVPASQSKNLTMQSEGKIKGFRIDFLLPCNVRKYDNLGSYTLQEDVIFVGEYFGYYGQEYEEKTKIKTEWQNTIESAIDQRCLHISNTKLKDICSILQDKKINSKCYPDYVSNNFDINDENNKKILFLRSQLHNFVYTYLINELLWHIKYDYSKLNNESLEIVKNKNKSYLDEFEQLFLECDNLKISEIVKRCSSILSSYDIKFKKEQNKRTANYKVRIR